MKYRKALLLAALLMVSPAWARKKTDVIVMKNGDKITCEVKGLRSNTLYIRVDYILSTLSVDWTKVDHIDSKQLFIVRTSGGTIYTGTLSSPEKPGARPVQIEVVESSGKAVTLDRSAVVDMDQTSDSVWQRFSGETGLGFTYTKGNQTSQYNLSSEVTYAEERWSARANFSSNLASSAGSNVSTRNELHLSGQRMMAWSNWYYTGIADFLQSSVLGIQRQSSLGAAIGYNIKNSGATFLTVYGGFAWQQINYQETHLPSPTQQVAAALVGSEAKLFHFDRTTVIVNANVLPTLSDPGRVQFNLNTSYYVRLASKLKWNFTFYGSWDNRPPPGFATSDYGASTGLSLTFGNR